MLHMMQIWGNDWVKINVYTKGSIFIMYLFKIYFHPNQRKGLVIEPSTHFLIYQTSKLVSLAPYFSRWISATVPDLNQCESNDQTQTTLWVESNRWESESIQWRSRWSGCDSSRWRLWMDVSGCDSSLGWITVEGRQYDPETWSTVSTFWSPSSHSQRR